MPRSIAVLALAVTLTVPLAAATRITYELGGAPTAIEWDRTAFPLHYDIDQRLAQAYPAAAGMVDRAVRSWTSVPDANVQFQSDGVVPNATPNGASRIAISLASDLFRDQGAAATTALTYDRQTGRMIGAQIEVDPSAFAGGIDGQMALTHEFGHVLGLDHSAVLSAIMYPYVGSGGDSPADLDIDDRIAIANIYPRRDPMLSGAVLTGRVSGDQGGIFTAQVVAMNEAGEPVATVLTNSTGEFSLAGVPQGRYRLYAEPLDGPVDPDALQGTWRQAKGIAFPTEFFGPAIEVENGRVYGNLVLSSAGPVQLNPKWIGVSSIDRTDVSLSTSPATVRPGETVTVTVGGDGFTSGMTTFDVINPSFRRVSDYTWSDNFVRANYVVEGSAPASSSVVLVKSGRDTAALTGALRVYRPARSRAARH